MIRMALHGARAHARRLGLVSAAIVVGVTFMAGTLVLTETVRATTTAQTAADQPPGLDAVVFGPAPSHKRRCLRSPPYRAWPGRRGLCRATPRCWWGDDWWVRPNPQPCRSPACRDFGPVTLSWVIFRSPTTRSSWTPAPSMPSIFGSVSGCRSSRASRSDFHHCRSVGWSEQPEFTECHPGRRQLDRSSAIDRTRGPGQRSLRLGVAGGRGGHPGSEAAGGARTFLPSPDPIRLLGPGRRTGLAQSPVLLHYIDRPRRHRPDRWGVHHLQCLLPRGCPAAPGAGCASLPRGQPSPAGSRGHR
jgi:hypothetical protein